MSWTKIRDMEFVFKFPSLRVQAELETLFGIDSMQDKNVEAIVTKKLNEPDTVDALIPVICEKFPPGKFSEMLRKKELQALVTDFFGLMGEEIAQDSSDDIKRFRDIIAGKVAKASQDASQ